MDVQNEPVVIDQSIYAQRKIGGTLMSAIMGVNKYITPVQAWDQLVHGTQTTDNKYMIAGRKLEHVVANWYAEESGLTVLVPGEPLYVHPKHDFLTAMPDRFVIDGTKKNVLECKTTQKQLETPDEAWFIQGQHYCNVLGLDGVAIAWLERGLDFKHHFYERNDEFIEAMTEVAVQFWNDYVVPCVPPPPQSASDIELLYKTHITGAVVEADDTLLNVYTDLKNIKEQIAHLEIDKDLKEEQIKLALRDNEALTYVGETLVTWKASKPAERFDLDRFKKEQPGWYEQYKKTSAGARRFVVK